MSDFANRSPEHESLAAEWGLLKIELHHCKKQRDGARELLRVALGLLRVARFETDFEGRRCFDLDRKIEKALEAK